MVIGNTFVEVPLALSVTLKVKEVGPPAVVGVPLITPLELRVSPTGNVPEVMLQLYGAVPPVAVNVCEYAAPVVPFNKLPVVIVKLLTLVWTNRMTA